MKVRHHTMFKSLSVEPERDKASGRGFPFSESGKQPTGQPTAEVMVNPTISLAEFLSGCHCPAFNPQRLKTETARALANKLLVFRHIYKLAEAAEVCNERGRIRFQNGDNSDTRLKRIP